MMRGGRRRTLASINHAAACVVKRAEIVNGTLAEILHPPIKCDVARSCEAVGRLRQRHGLIVKGKRISCPPHYAPPNNDYDPPHHDYEHGFPLIRSLRASTQRSTSVLFSFVLCLLIVAGSFAIRQSETIPAAPGAWERALRLLELQLPYPLPV